MEHMFSACCQLLDWVDICRARQDPVAVTSEPQHVQPITCVGSATRDENAAEQLLQFINAQLESVSELV